MKLILANIFSAIGAGLLTYSTFSKDIISYSSVGRASDC